MDILIDTSNEQRGIKTEYDNKSKMNVKAECPLEKTVELQFNVTQESSMCKGSVMSYKLSHM